MCGCVVTIRDMKIDYHRSGVGQLWFEKPYDIDVLIIIFENSDIVSLCTKKRENITPLYTRHNKDRSSIEPRL